MEAIICGRAELRSSAVANTLETAYCAFNRGRMLRDPVSPLREGWRCGPLGIIRPILHSRRPPSECLKNTLVTHRVDRDGSQYSASFLIWDAQQPSSSDTAILIVVNSLPSLMLLRIFAVLLLVALPASAADEFTLYDLQPPETHQFAIVYDVTETHEGAPFFFNPIRPGSTASKERVIERSSGKELQFETVTGKDAKASGLLPPQ